MDDEALDLLLERDVPCVPALHFEQASIERGPEFGLPQARDRRPQGDARRRRRKRRRSCGGRPAGHGRRLRLRLEPARRLRQGADLLRQVRRPHAAGSASPAPRRPARRSWAAATSSARWRRANWPTCWSWMATWLADIALLEDRSRFIAVMQGGIVKAGRLRTATVL